jgi:tetratricopeptide (TPR) repeat protein
MSISQFTYLSIIIYSIIFATACSTNADDQQALQQSEVPSLQLNEAICTEFAVKLHESFVQDDSTFLNSYINWESLRIKSAAFVTKKDSLLIDYAWWLLKKSFYPGRDFAKVNSLGGAMRFVMYYKENFDEHHIILRTFYPPQHLNFYDFTLGTKGAFLTIEDIYSYEMAASLSTLLGEQMDVLVKLSDDKLSMETYHHAIQNALQAAQKLNESGKITQAYKQLISLDELYKSTNYYKHIELSVLFQSPDEKVQLSALNKRINSISIEEKGRWLLLFYQSGLQGNYQQARLCIQNLKDWIGEDEMLTYLEAVTYYEAGDYLTSIELLNNVIASEQDFYIVFYAKLTAQIEIADYSAAIETLQQIVLLFDAGHINWDKELMAYPDFLMSDEYDDWLNGTALPL